MAKRLHHLYSLVVVVLSQFAIAAPFAYVTSDTDNLVAVIDTATNSIVTNIAVGTQPYGVAVNPAGTRIYVANTASATVSVIDTSSNTVIASIPISGVPRGIAVSPNGARIYVTSQGLPFNVSVIDTASNTVVASVPVGDSARGIVVNPTGTRVYVAINGADQIVEINTAANTVSSTIASGGSGPYGMAVNPAGTRLYGTNRLSGSVTVYDITTSVAPITTFAVGSDPLGVAVSTNLSRAYVTNSLSDTVSILDTASNSVLASVPVGAFPLGIAVSGDGSRAYSVNSNSHNVTVINTGSNTVVATVTGVNNPNGFGQFVSQAAPATVPGAPSIVSATPGNSQATISFTAPASDGGSPITGYTVTCNPGAISAGGAASPITVTGLMNGTNYSCSVAATNAIGTGPSTPPAMVTPGVAAISVMGTTTFPSTTVGGSSGVQAITITNSGTANLSISSITHTGAVNFKDTTSGPPPNAAHYCGFGSDAGGVPQSGGPIVLAPAASCTLNLAYTATAVGAQNATITINSNAPTSPTAINLSGTGVAPASTMSPGSIAFGNVPITLPVNQTGTFTNNSAASYTLTAFANSDARFTVTGNGASPCNVGTVVNGGASCTYQATFTPTGSGAYNNTLTISFTSGAVATVFSQSQNSNGTGYLLPFTLSPPSIGFGSVPVGSTVNQTFTLTNNSNSTPFPTNYTINNFSFSGLGFSAVGSGGSPCNNGAVLMPATSCTVTASVTPSGTGSTNGTVSIGFLGGLGANPQYTASESLNALGVNAIPTITQMGSPAMPVVPGLTVNMNLTVSGGAGTPTGTVTVVLRNLSTMAVVNINGGTCLNAGLSAGSFNCPYIAPAAGNYAIEVSYSGDGNYQSGLATFPLTTAQAVPTITQMGSPANAVPGQNVMMQLSVTSSSPLGPPTGSVTVLLRNLSTMSVVNISGGVCLMAGLSSGNFTCPYTAPPAGNYQIEVNYSGDTPNASTVATFLLTTAQAVPTVTQMGSPANAVPGQNVNMMLNVTSSSPLGPPTGSVTVLLRNLSTMSVVNISGGVCLMAGLSSGNFTCPYTAPPAGNYQIEVNYSGDTPNAPVTASFGLTVAAVTGPFAYVANQSSNNVSVIDVPTNTVVATVPVGSFPIGVAVDSSGTRAYVANNGSANVSVIDAGSNTVVATVPVGASPYSVAIKPSGTGVYVANFGANSVSLIDTATNTVTATIPVGNAPTSIAVHPAGTRVYVGNQNSQDVSVIDTGSNAVIATVPIGGVATGLAVHPDGSRVFVARPAASSNTIIVIDTATNSVVNSFSSGSATNNDTQVLSVNIAGTRIYATNQNSNTVTVIDSTSGALLSTIPVGTSPHGIAFDPTGARAYVANSGTNNVSVIDTGTNSVIGTIAVGSAPFSMGIFIRRTFGPLIAPMISSAAPAGGSLTVPYTHTFTATGTAPFNWGLAAGTLPAGLTLDALTGALSGTPTAAGSFGFTVQATNGVAPAGTQAVTLAIAAAPAPIFSPSATSFSFGNVLLTTVATPQSLIITNNGLANLNVSSASLTGASPSDYSVNSTPCPSPILPAATCVISIGFTPLGQGVRNATLTIISDAAGSPHVFTLTGTGALPTATYAPGSLNFGSLAVGTTSASQQFTFTNTSPIILSPSSISFLGGGAGFAILPSSSCLMTPMLASMASCTVDITSTPNATGTLTDTVVVNTSPNNQATPAGVTLTVIGLAPPTPTLTVGFAPTTTNTGVNSTLTFTLTNPAASPATISIGSAVPVTGLTLSGLVDGCGLGAFISTGSVDFGMAGTIPAMGTCTVTVQAQSAVAGSFPVTVNPGNLITNRGNNANTSTATLTVAASIPTVVLSNGSLGFGSRTVNTTSPVQTVTLTNGGTGNLIISAMTVTGDFAFTTNCPISTPPIAPASPACNINVTFTPLTVGLLNGSITITSNAPGSPHTILLTGTGLAVPAPAIGLSATGIALGPTVVNTQSSPQSLIVTNTGFANLNITGIAVSGAGIVRVTPASASPVNCATSVAPSSTCQIAVACTPTAPGTFTGQISITHNASGSPSIVNLTCTASPLPVAILSLTPALDFGDQVINTPSGLRAANIANTGTAPLTVSGIALSGTDANQFTQTGNCSTLAAGTSCDVLIGFTPTSIGNKAAGLVVTSNAQNATTVNRVALSGNGVLAPRPIATPGATAIGFGNTIFGGASPTQLMNFKNDGGSPMAIASIVTVGDFTQMNNCGGTLASMATCSINVAFNPLGQGQRSGELQIFTNAQGSPHKVILSGNGCRWFSQPGSRFFLTAC